MKILRKDKEGFFFFFSTHPASFKKNIISGHFSRGGGLQNVTSWILPNLLSITLQITICIHSNTNSLPLKHKFASYRKTICNTTRSELWYWLISDEIHSGGISCFKTNIYLLLNYLQFGGCPTEGIVDPLLYIAFF